MAPSKMRSQRHSTGCVALTGHAAVADATRARISEAARTLSWPPSLRARALFTGH
jgi:DNA-binding LacI/PurR family transcriptional regulator